MNARPTDTLAIAVAQLNPTVGDIDGNAGKARAARAQAARDGADLVAFSELFICGYPPEDLVLKPALQAACRAKVEELARETADGGPAMLIGTPWVEDGKLYNAYCLLDGGAIAAVRRKVDLPNYGVFDEKRVFAPGPMPGPVNFRGVRLGVPICEDIWGADVVETLAETGTELMIVPNGSPYHRDKDDVRLNIAVARVTESDLPMVYVNQVGAQDELVFDGASFGLHADRSLAFQLPAFTEQVTTVRWQRSGNSWRCVGGPVAKLIERRRSRGLHRLRARLARLRRQERLQGRGARPVRRHRFRAGGGDVGRRARRRARALRDAAVSLHLAGVARRCGRGRQGAAASSTTWCRSRKPCRGSKQTLAPLFKDLPRDVTEENLQARARGTILMAVSNKFGLMVVTTGNKSEMSVGYATLYGDMNGGFNPVKDLYKTEVYRLARLRNLWKPDGALGPDGPGHPRATSSPARRPRSCARTRPTRIRCRPTTRSTRSSNGWSSARSRSRRSSRRASTRRRWPRSRACSTSPNTSAASRRRA